MLALALAPAQNPPALPGQRTRRLAEWQLVLDPQGCAHPRDLSAAARAGGIAVTVPHVWQTLAPRHDGVAWYGCTCEIAAAELAGRLRLRCGAANYRAEVFVNGVSAGVHEGGYTPFTVDLTAAVRPGRNELWVRVVSPPRDHQIEGLQASSPIRQTPVPSWKTGWYHPFGGLWQDVHLLATPACWLEDAFIQPRLDPRGIVCQLTIANRSGAPLSGRLHAWVSALGQDRCLAALEQELAIPAAGAEARLELALPRAALWQLHAPARHELHLALTTPAGRDERTWRFGLRQFTTDGRSFYLNGEKIFLRGVLQQGLYPRTLASPESEDFARHELAMLKAAGVNLVRAHLKPTPEFVLELADELGLLVIGEPPTGWVSYDEHVERRIENDIREMILRDRNHPCLAMWTFFNEMTDTFYARERDPAALVERCCRLGRQLDPTRLMTGNSGRGAHEGEAVGFGIFGQGLAQPLPLADEHLYRRIPLTESDEAGLRRLQPDPDGLLWIGEFGTSSFPDLEAVLARYDAADRELGDYRQNRNYRDGLVAGYRAFDLQRLYPQPQDFYLALAQDHVETTAAMQRALRCNPRVAGYVITQLADAASEFGGVLDFWREPKAVYPVFRHYNQDRLALLAAPRTRLYAGETLEFEAWLSNVSGRAAPAAGECRLWQDEHALASWPLAAPAAEVACLLAARQVLPAAGNYRLELVLEVAGQSCCDSLPLHVLAPPWPAAPAFTLLDSTSPARSPFPSLLGRRLRELGLRLEDQGEQRNPQDRPVLVHLRGREATLQRFRATRVLREEVLAGRNVLFVDCDFSCLSYFFEDATPRELYGVGAYAGNPGLALDDRNFPFAGPRRALGRAYAASYPRVMLDAAQCRQQGWEVLALHALPDQFGNPDRIDWGASLVGGRLGRGRWLACTFRLFDHLGHDPVSDDLLVRLLRAVATT